ncbi:MAG TPA: NAD(+)/NADH kinase [Firmicutes bacterium]|uniref:NAD kinase n=1 Tax=Capillibacterium thermochitinicola TaxID=2699427 RepID=A0A8J6I0D9_9FIRM|nr:NAD(+)/NADH kinase [Capillibacterium thermochitinicola]MBA2133136.1 NAD(+)/NADH kinase [Capillibacterium thermochitinicola]HHW11826.1 NAD(+)/NADH kinase [Bacillota bacterium]
MKKIGVFPLFEKPEAARVARKLIHLLAQAGFQVVMEEESAARLDAAELGCRKEDLPAQLDYGVVLGGDGALLSLARRLYPWEIPIFGINLGHLGFLTEVEDKELESAVEKLRRGEFVVENRIMVNAEVTSAGKQRACLVGLNDIVISKGLFSRMLRLELLIDGFFTGMLAADGLIVATPTGSTAYSLSAGGPIVSPQLSALVLTPICAHSLFNRPLVVDSNAVIEIKFTAPPHEVLLTADGQECLGLEAEDGIKIYTAPHRTKFIRFKEKSFYHILREKVKEGKL